MKKLSFLLLLSLFASSCQTETLSTEGTDEPAEESAEAALPDHPVIYVSIASHNEEPSLKQPDYLADEELFWEHRDALVEWANMLHEEGVAYDWQSDWNFLKAIAEYDTGTESTNGKNVALWMQEDLGFAIDPHAHESKYNYADVAYLMESIGLKPSGVVGGYLASPIEDSKVDYLQNPIEGWVYEYTWTPEILWGGGTGNHVNEEGLWTSGIWRPSSSADYFTHNEEALPSVGNYARTWDGLRDLLEKAENGELENGVIYTITIMNDQKNFVESGYIEAFQEELNSFDSYSEAGLIEWVTLTEVVEIWETQYGAEPNILQYDEEAASKIFTDSSTEFPKDKPDRTEGNFPFKQN